MVFWQKTSGFDLNLDLKFLSIIVEILILNINIHNNY